jgi:hypothetical protein
MKKVLLSFIQFLVIASVVAQTAGEKYDRAMETHPVRFGIKVGLNAANLAVTNSGGAIDEKKNIAGWQAGLYLDMPILPIVSIQAGAFLSSKGSKFTSGDKPAGFYAEVDTRPIYIEVPVNAIVKIPLPNKVKLFAGAGPYLGIGVAGKNKSEGAFAGVPFSTKDNISYTDKDESNGTSYGAHLKRLDMGLNFLAGLEISHMTLNANYGYGISNIKSNQDGDDTKFRNRVFSVAIGLLF